MRLSKGLTTWCVRVGQTALMWRWNMPLRQAVLADGEGEHSTPRIRLAWEKAGRGLRWRGTDLERALDDR